MAFRPRFSKRSHFGEIDDDALFFGRLLARHPRALDLRASNPTQLGLPSAWTAPSDFDGIYVPDPRGSRKARDLIARSYDARTSISADQVLLTASTSEAYSYLFLALCDPGDAVLVPRPSYPLFADLARLAGVRLIEYHYLYDGRWGLDLGSLPTHETLAKERVRLVVAVSPNNPTGNTLSQSELAALGALHLPLAIDEVFGPYRWSTHPDDSEPLQEKTTAPLLLLDGLSKRACSPGAKLGWIVARGPGSQELLDRLEWIGDTYLSVNACAQHSLQRVLEREDEVQERVLTRVRHNLSLLQELTHGTALTPCAGDGGWSKVLRFPGTLDERTWHRLLVEDGLHVQPGVLYGIPFEASFVLSLITPEPTWREGLSRLLRIVQRELARR